MRLAAAAAAAASDKRAPRRRRQHLLQLGRHPGALPGSRLGEQGRHGVRVAAQRGGIAAAGGLGARQRGQQGQQAWLGEPLVAAAHVACLWGHGGSRRGRQRQQRSVGQQALEALVGGTRCGVAPPAWRTSGERAWAGLGWAALGPGGPGQLPAPPTSPADPQPQEYPPTAGPQKPLLAQPGPAHTSALTPLAHARSLPGFQAPSTAAPSAERAPRAPPPPPAARCRLPPPPPPLLDELAGTAAASAPASGAPRAAAGSEALPLLPPVPGERRATGAPPRGAAARRRTEQTPAGAPRAASHAAARRAAVAPGARRAAAY